VCAGYERGPNRRVTRIEGRRPPGSCSPPAGCSAPPHGVPLPAVLASASSPALVLRRTALVAVPHRRLDGGFDAVAHAALLRACTARFDLAGPT